MKPEIRKVKDGVVSGENEVLIPISQEDSEKLREALAIVQKYEKIALDTYKSKYKYNPKKDSDWCEVAYAVKNDKVIVKITDGMAG